MDLDELSREAQRGSGLLLLRSQTATVSEREALKQVVDEVKERLVKANNAGYFKGCEEGQQKALSQQAQARAADAHPHGVATGEDGRRTLYVNEFKVRSIDDANRLRGLRADQVCTFRDWGMPQRIRDYLENEVIAPIIADANDRNPPKDPPHQSADWALWVVKRIEAVEQKAGQLGALVTPGGQERAHLTLPQLCHKLETDTASRATVEELFKRVEGLEKGEAALEKVNTGHARRLHNLEVGASNREEWFNAVTARLNAIEIWKHDTLAKTLTELVEKVELALGRTEGLDARCGENQRAHNELNATVLKNAEEFEDKLRQHRAIFHDLDVRLKKEETRPEPDHRNRFIRWDTQIEQLNARLLALETSDDNPGAKKIERARLINEYMAEQRGPTQGPDARHPVQQLTLDEAFENWRASKWGPEHAHLEKAFGEATVEQHRDLSAVMEASFRAGWNARKP
jgi:hypothetical protein